ncbi:MAG: hypothetical protein GWP35_06520 [Proteobacteria bacterium]|nr:hypothetical protein [Pseudomonadota bacterium]
MVARDNDGEVLDSAKANSRIAGVQLSFKNQSILDLQSDGPARTLVTNPPYGKRLSSDDEFLGKMGAVIRRLHGWRVAILSGSSNIERAIKIPPVNSIPLVNGDLDCQLLIYQID